MLFVHVVMLATPKVQQIMKHVFEVYSGIQQTVK